MKVKIYDSGSGNIGYVLMLVQIKIYKKSAMSNEYLCSAVFCMTACRIVFWRRLWMVLKNLTIRYDGF